MTNKTISFQPSTRILKVLASSPMKPLDAISELIDNSIDALQNTSLKEKQIQITLPTKGEIKNNEGEILFFDNGPGMNSKQLGDALAAGLSSKGEDDSLGLYGVGFNIAISKLGRKTTIVTKRKDAPKAIEVIFDVDKISKTGGREFITEYNEVECDFPHGTRITISSWWPEGEANDSYINSLVNLKDSKVRKTLSRRYATVLRGYHIRIFYKRKPLYPFEHCIWDENRSAEYGIKLKKDEVGNLEEIIPAKCMIDEIIETVNKCVECGVILRNEDPCHCGSVDRESYDNKIKGWIGIQRYESSDAGIDFIRNGRCILEADKSLFGYFDDNNRWIQEYPGKRHNLKSRIVGEIHVDHCLPDFTKQKFQETKPWEKVKKYLRGDLYKSISISPDDPQAAPDLETRKSIIPLMYRAYSYIRPDRLGRACLYIGDRTGTEVVRDPNREKELVNEFDNELLKAPEDRDLKIINDSKWWEIIETLEDYNHGLIICKNKECNSQLDVTDEICHECNTIMIGKTCINDKCGKEIPRSQKICMHCDHDQNLKSVNWICKYCTTKNSKSNDFCCKCNLPRNFVDQLSKEYLLKYSNEEESFGRSNIFIEKSIGKKTNPFNCRVYFTKQLIKEPFGSDIPLYREKYDNTLFIFINKKHNIFNQATVSEIEIIANEISSHIINYELGLETYEVKKFNHTYVLNYILSTYYNNQKYLDSLVSKVILIFDEIKSMLIENLSENEKMEIYDSLSPIDKLEIDNKNISKEIIKNSFLNFLPLDSIYEIFKNNIEVLIKLKCFKFSDEMVDDPEIFKVILSKNKKLILSAFESLKDLNFIVNSKNSDIDEAEIKFRKINAEAAINLLSEKYLK